MRLSRWTLDSLKPARRKRRFIAMVRATLVLAAPFAALIDAGPVRAQDALQLMSAPGSLIIEAAGDKRIKFKVAPASAFDGEASATLYRYDDNGEVSQSPLKDYRMSRTKASGGQQISVNVSLPGAGLYVLDMKLMSRSGDEVASQKVSLAVLAAGQGSFSEAGVQTHFAHKKGVPSIVLPLVKRAGFTWIRDEVYWSAIEKTPGQFLLPRNDNDYGGYVRQAVRMNLKPLIELDFGNKQAYPNLFKGPQGFPQTQEERELFLRYVDKVVGFYKGYVKTWEVWNEPNFASMGGYDAYLALLKPVYTLVKKHSPDATVLSCGGGGAGGGPGGDCIAAIAKADALGYQDGFSIHPYMSPYDPDHGYSAKGSPLSQVNVPNVWQHLQRMTQSHPKPGVGPLGVYVTEIGWPSSPEDAGLSERKQAAAAARTFLLSRRFNTMKTVMWYDFVDDGVNPRDKEANFGLLRLDLSPKPAYVAVATVFRTVGNRMWKRSFVDNETTKVYQYCERDEGDCVIAGWRRDADDGPVNTPVPIPPGKYTQIDWQGGTSTIEVNDSFEWKLGVLPKYLVPARKY